MEGPAKFSSSNQVYLLKEKLTGEKERTALNLRIKFYLVIKAEDLSPRCSLSGSSEGLFQGSRGGAGIYGSFFFVCFLFLFVVDFVIH